MHSHFLYKTILKKRRSASFSFFLRMWFVFYVVFSLLFSIGKAKKKCSAQVRVLCIGDSLTKGYYGDKGSYHPYTEVLQSMLSDYIKDNVRVETRGKGGEKVHTQMRERLNKELRKSEYDMVVVLGGVNDLVNLSFQQNQHLFEDLLAMYTSAKKHRVKAVAMTILPVHVNKQKLKYLSRCQFEKLRRRVNSKIRKTIRNSRSKSDILLCDIDRSFPAFFSDRYWTADEVHPSPAGYDKLGEIVFDCIKNTVRKLAMNKYVRC